MRKDPNRSAGFAMVILAVLMCVPAARAADANGVVNINTATAEQLAMLPRVGPSVAGRIIEFRQQNGSFKDTSDLLLIKGIGDKTFELIEPYVTITGESSLKEKAKVERGGGAPSRG